MHEKYSGNGYHISHRFKNLNLKIFKCTEYNSLYMYTRTSLVMSNGNYFKGWK